MWICLFLCVCAIYVSEKDDEGRQGQRSGGANGNAGDECLFQSLGVRKQDVRKRYWTRVDQTHEKKGTRRSGFPSKFNLSRISAQHHRCNGKSIQCPSNVPVLMTITSLWALLCSVVLVPHNLGAFESLRNLVGNHVRFRAQMVQIDRKTQ